MSETANESVQALVNHARGHALGDLLRRSAARFPDKLAVVAGSHRQTYREFNASVNAVAAEVSSRGVAFGDRIALLSRNCWEYAVLNFALAKIGAVMVPINFMLSAPEVAYILQHSGASGMIVEDGLREIAGPALASAGITQGIRGWIGAGPAVCPPGWSEVASWAVRTDADEPDVVVGDDDLMHLMYTSGTESRPKGAMLSSRSLIAQYVSAIVDGGMEADDVEVHALPMYHCAQMHCFFVPDVYLGATNVILPDAGAARLLATIEAEGVTKLFAPPTVWISLLRSPEFDTTNLSTLRKGYYGASAMPVEVLREIQRRLPDVRLWNFYGQTELAPVATILKPEDQLARPGSAGKPVLNVETVLLDDDDRPVAADEVGEIAHRSPQVVLGYWNDRDKTADAFRNGWFHSGDLGVMTEDGYLSVVDRKKDMIKTGGENVASREVEEAIYLLDGVAEVAVFGIDHPHWVEAVAAVVVPRPGADITAETVQEHARAVLAGFKRPKYVVIGGQLPKNPSGKILKRELRQIYADLAREDGQ